MFSLGQHMIQWQSCSHSKKMNYGVKLLLVPPRLCRCTLLQIAFGEDEVSDEVLLPDFMFYLCQDDRALLTRALGGFSDLSDSDQEELLNFYAVYGMQRRPTNGTLNEDPLTIAREVLVERPAKFIRIPEEFAALFFSQLTVEKVTVMYAKLRPTAAAVAACIIAVNEAMMRAEDV
ncbi:hypothetical protein LSAT2_009726 [Lamellibrachia satsuma]|nr:hypothetical protein LSAT2_009726 [Lamellibrachia satsuma]